MSVLAAIWLLDFFFSFGVGCFCFLGFFFMFFLGGGCFVFVGFFLVGFFFCLLCKLLA